MAEEPSSMGQASRGTGTCEPAAARSETPWTRPTRRVLTRLTEVTGTGVGKSGVGGDGMSSEMMS